MLDMVTQSWLHWAVVLQWLLTVDHDRAGLSKCQIVVIDWFSVARPQRMTWNSLLNVCSLSFEEFNETSIKWHWRLLHLTESYNAGVDAWWTHQIQWPNIGVQVPQHNCVSLCVLIKESILYNTEAPYSKSVEQGLSKLWAWDWIVVCNQRDSTWYLDVRRYHCEMLAESHTLCICRKRLPIGNGASFNLTATCSHAGPPFPSIHRCKSSLVVSAPWYKSACSPHSDAYLLHMRSEQ